MSPGEVRRKTANPNAGPPQKCDFCIAHDALIGPLAAAADAQPTTIHRQQSGSRKKSRDPRKNRHRPAEMEIGEWNPASTTAASAAAPTNMDMATFSQILNCLQLKNAIEREYTQSLNLLRIAENGRNRSFVATVSAPRMNETVRERDSPSPETERDPTYRESTSESLRCLATGHYSLSRYRNGKARDPDCRDRQARDSI